ncbi:MAG: thioether cross-link-forming SCIFF peptide maturase, partial [Eubacteriales bacterium]|nr:thioether cross-link-forming SCIFF peptide maturase [Eubacteriales bacterium]
MIHPYKLNGYNIIIDVCSGAVHVVDDVAYDMIVMCETEPEEKVLSAILEKYHDRPDVTEEDL